MKKTVWLKLLACLMAFCILLVGCASEGTSGSGSDDEDSKSVSSEKEEEINVEPGELSVDAVRSKVKNSPFTKKSKAISELDFDKLALNMELRVELGKAFGDFVDTMSGSNTSAAIDALGIKSASVSADFNRNSDLYSVVAEGSINDKVVIDGNATLDLSDMMVYFSLPTLSGDTLGADFSEVADEFNMEFASVYEEVMGMLSQQMDARDELVSGLESALTEDELFEILDGYVEVINDSLEFEEEETTISVDSIEQKVDAYIYEIDAADAQNLLEALLTKVTEDELLEEKFLEIYPLVMEYLDVVSGGELVGGYTSDAEAVYDAYISEIEDMLDDLGEVDEDDSSAVIVTTYFAGDDFVGFSFGNEEMGSVIDFYTVRDGNDLGAGLFTDGACIKLVGNDKGGKYNGVLTFEVEGEEIALNIENVDMNKLEEGSLNGTIAMYAKNFPQLKDLGVSDEFAVKLSLDTDNLSYVKIGVSAEEKGQKIVSASLNVKVSDKAKKVSVPSRYIDVVNDTDGVEAWAADIAENGLSKIVGNLKKAGISQQVLSMLEANLY
ncbi:MAG: hypothetical protein IJW06_04075 [Clostridia bacterium]|nr:hypothetical protein [Clostridia bacterium]